METNWYEDLVGLSDERKNAELEKARSGFFTDDRAKAQGVSPKANKTAVSRSPSSTSTSKGMVGAGSAIAQGGDADDAAASGLMASGNPYAMAGGAALSILNARTKAKNAQAQQAHQEEMAKTGNIAKIMQNWQGMS